MGVYVLKDCINNFGFMDGVSFWFRMSFRDPIQMWYWQTFQTRQWCAWEGYGCTKGKDCEHEHYRKPPDTKDYPIEDGELCEYCDEEPATTHTHNPNSNEKPPFYWKVCENCVEGIHLQETQSLHATMMIRFPSESGKKHAEEGLKKSNDKIAEFEKRTGKKLMSIGMSVLESGKIDAKEIKNNSRDSEKNTHS